MVGDRESDLQAGLRANIRAAAVCTGKHSAAEWTVLAPPGVQIFPSVVELVATLT
jgi:phosphoglycolate phosphatase-like HAD superfamily hydrolase